MSFTYNGVLIYIFVDAHCEHPFDILIWTHQIVICFHICKENNIDVKSMEFLYGNIFFLSVIKRIIYLSPGLVYFWPQHSLYVQ